jgi:hypothetical protein
MLTLLVCGINGGVQSQISAYSLPRIRDALLKAYNGQDAGALHAMLSMALQNRYSSEKLSSSLTMCRVLTHTILRTQGPVWGNRWHGWFAVEAEAGEFQMILEIDRHEKIIHLMITDDLDARRQQCWISYIDQPS